MRHCALCGQNGHNVRTCKNRKESTAAVIIVPVSQVSSSGIPAVEAEAQDLMPPSESEQEDPASSTFPFGEEQIIFSKPRKGLWLVSQSRKRIAGKILQVKSDGKILYENTLGCYCETDLGKTIEADYQIVDLQPTMLSWRSI